MGVRQAWNIGVPEGFDNHKVAGTWAGPKQGKDNLGSDPLGPTFLPDFVATEQGTVKVFDGLDTRILTPHPFLKTAFHGGIE